MVKTPAGDGSEFVGGAGGESAAGDLPATLRLVVGLSAAAFLVEIGAATIAGSVALLADSIDFLEDLSLNALVLAGLSWSARSRGRLGMALSAVLLAPTLATAVAAWREFGRGHPPQTAVVGATAVAALAVNASCAALLLRHRTAGGSLVRAAFLSARNDMVGNLAILLAAALTAIVRSPLPDLFVGVGIGILNARAAGEVWAASRREHDGLPADRPPDLGNPLRSDAGRESPSS